MHRVFFDTNTGSEKDGYFLVFAQSRADIEKIGPDLRDGTKVTLYMPEELEVTAELQYDHERQCWKGIPRGNWRYI